MSRTGSVLSRALWQVVFAGVLVFIAVPILLVVWIGFSDAERISLTASGSISVHAISSFLTDPQWSDALRRSLLVAAVVAVAAVAAGSLAAFINVRPGGRWRAVSAALVITPSVIPTVVYALALTLFSAQTGADPLLVLIVGHTVLAMPFTFLVMRVGLAALPTELIAAARMLGASPALIVVRVVVPLLAPSAFVAAALAGSVSLAEPVLAIFLLNDSTATLPQKSFQGLRFSFDPAILTAAAIIVLATIAVVVPALLVLYRQRRRFQR